MVGFSACSGQPACVVYCAIKGFAYRYLLLKFLSDVVMNPSSKWTLARKYRCTRRPAKRNCGKSVRKSDAPGHQLVNGWGLYFDTESAPVSYHVDHIIDRNHQNVFHRNIPSLDVLSFANSENSFLHHAAPLFTEDCFLSGGDVFRASVHRVVHTCGKRIMAAVQGDTRRIAEPDGRHWDINRRRPLFQSKNTPCLTSPTMVSSGTNSMFPCHGLPFGIAVNGPSSKLSAAEFFALHSDCCMLVGVHIDLSQWLAFVRKSCASRSSLWMERCPSDTVRDVWGRNAHR